MQSRRIPIVLVASLLVFAGALSGQSTFATITGVVTDPTGAVIPNASIEITLVARDQKFTATSNEVGNYTFANIPNGRYSMLAKAAGFQDFRVEDINLDSRENRRIDITFVVGQVGTAIEVSAGAALIETETARISQTKEREVMRNLPLSLRRVWDFVTMTPMVDNNNWQFRLGGSQSNQTDATIDGASLGLVGVNLPGPIMDRSDFIAEMRIDVAQTGAESASIGQVTLVSRSGTNAFHGTVADYYETPRLKARNPFSTTGDRQRLHAMTFAAGGPVYIPKIYNGRNKTFFFHTTEANFQSGFDSLINRTVPPESWRSGNLSSVTAAIKDPANNNAPFSGNIIPKSRLNSVTLALQDLMPLPNYGDTTVYAIQNFRENRKGTTSHQPTTTQRIDHRISDSTLLFGRWTATRWLLDGIPSGLPLVRDKMTRSQRNLDAVTIAITHSFSPVLLYEFRFGMSTDRSFGWGIIDGPAFAKQLGLQGLASGIPENATGIYSASFSNLTMSAPSDSSRSDNGQWGHNFTNNVTWIRNTHTWKFGYYLKRGNYYSRNHSNMFGSGSFTGNFTGHAYADFLLGIPSSMGRSYPALAQSVSPYSHGLFVTDEWKVNRKLTLTVGLRWDLFLPQGEENNYLSVFDVASGKVVVPDGMLSKISPLMPLSYVGVVEASTAGRPQRMYSADKNNFQPRFSLAYRPWGNNTVFRGGVGLYFNQSAAGASASSVPYNISQPNYTNPSTGFLVLPQVFPSQGASGPTTVSLPGTGDPNLKVPRTLQSSFSIDHQRWDMGFHIGWVGTYQRLGTYGRNINQPPVDTRLYIQKLDTIPFPNYPAISYTENGTSYNYNSLTLQVERRMKRGVYYQAYWTWARGISTGLGEDARSPFERFVNSGIPTSRFSANFIYELPFGRGKMWGANWHKLIDGMFGGWQISSIFALQSRSFLTPSWSLQDPFGTSYTTSSTRPTRSVRPNQFGDPNDIAERTIYRYFNTSVFSAPIPGVLGNAQVGGIRGVPLNTMHSGISKSVVVREQLRLKAELLMNNTLNHPNYNNPNTTISGTSAGMITSVMDRNSVLDSAIPRFCQIHMRIEW